MVVAIRAKTQVFRLLMVNRIYMPIPAIIMILAVRVPE